MKLRLRHGSNTDVSLYKDTAKFKQHYSLTQEKWNSHFLLEKKQNKNYCCQWLFLKLSCPRGTKIRALFFVLSAARIADDRGKFRFRLSLSLHLLVNTSFNTMPKAIRRKICFSILVRACVRKLFAEKKINKIKKRWDHINFKHL